MSTTEPTTSDTQPAEGAPDPATEEVTTVERSSGPEALRGTPLLGADQQQVLTDLLDGRWAGLRRTVRERMHATPHSPVTDLSTSEHRAATLTALRGIAAAEGGAFRSGFPEVVGGDGDIGGSVTAIEMLGYADLSLMVKAGVQWGLFGGAVSALGTEEHHRAYLPGAMDLTLLGAFAMTESGHGSDVESLRTTATYDPATDEIVVNTPSRDDRKDYIGNAAQDARVAVVFAQLVVGDESHGVHAVVVPVRDETGEALPGVTIGDCGRKGGLNGVDNGRLSFDDVRVPRSNLLNRYGDVSPDGTYTSPIENPKRRFFTMLGTLVRGRVSVAGAAAAATQSALTIAVRYASRRRQFERDTDADEVLLLDYQAHQRRLLPALATTYALHFAQSQLVSDLHDVQTAEQAGAAGGQADPDVLEALAGRQREIETRAAGLKALTTAHANQTLQTCREACGGAGYLAENLLVQLRGDVDVFSTFEGDNTVLLQLVGKSLLTGYKHHVGELDSLGVARFVAEQFVGSVIERTAAAGLISRLLGTAPGKDGERGLYDRAWHMDMFEEREKHVTETLAARLRSASGSQEDAFAAFNSCQDHLLRAARVHMHRVVLEAFLDAVDRCRDDSVARVLDALCDLYVLSELESDRAWFLEHGRLTPARAKQVTAAVDALCAGLAPHAGTLVDAFAIPDHLVDAAALS